LGAAFAMLSVMTGAFAAHGLKSMLAASQLTLFETAARYQMYHALALVGVGLVSIHPQFSRQLLKLSALSFLLGILLFSGSLYLLALYQIRWLGMITPLGGISFLAGWLLLMVAVLRNHPATD